MSVAGLAGLVLSIWLTARAWHTERPAALVLSPEETRIRRVALVVQRASGVCAAGLVTSILVLGLGGRLMMRVLAATSPDSAQGRFTDAEFRVGEVTLDGTVSFVLFVGLIGGILTVGAWVVLRRWLPNRSWMAGLILTGIGAGLLARSVGQSLANHRAHVAWGTCSSTRCRGVRIRGGAPDSGGDHGGRDLLCGMAATPFGTHAAMAQPHRPTGQMDPRSRGDDGHDLGRNLSDPSPHPLSTQHFERPSGWSSPEPIHVRQTDYRAHGSTESPGSTP